MIQEKSLAFAIRIVKLYKLLIGDKKEYVLLKQLLRSGTAIGAWQKKQNKLNQKLIFCRIQNTNPS